MGGQTFGNQISINLNFIAKKLDKGIRMQHIAADQEKVERFAEFMVELNEMVDEINKKVDEGLAKE